MGHPQPAKREEIMERALRITRLAGVLLALSALWGPAAADEPQPDGITGGIVIVRNCPKSEIKNFSYMLSSVPGGGWAEISNAGESFRLNFFSFTPEDLEAFNRLGSQTEPRINVILYNGDFVFMVRSSKEEYREEPPPEIQDPPVVGKGAPIVEL
jgi:hypothetical protein